MHVTLQPITNDNWYDCITLTPTAEQARIGFVAPNTHSLIQAHFEPWWQPYGLYAPIADQAVMVGFAMYGRWPATGVDPRHDNAKPGIDFILRFMIDARYQGQGYGRSALAALIAHSQAQPGWQALEISYDVANPAMQRLCTNAGFQPTGQVIDGEIEARLA